MNVNNDEKKEEKPSTESNKNSKNKKQDKKQGAGFISQHMAEFRKITWPSKDDLIKQTITVIFISVLVGVIIFAMDYAFNLGFLKLNNML